jgi:hypothetical protein
MSRLLTRRLPEWTCATVGVETQGGLQMVIGSGSPLPQSPSSDMTGRTTYTGRRLEWPSGFVNTAALLAINPRECCASTNFLPGGFGGARGCASTSRQN